MLRACLILSCLIASAAASAQTIVTPVDPLRLESDDFARLRDPADWTGLTVSRIEFRDDRAFWRMYRIANLAKPAGPLWYVPHDNENAAFQAALVEVRSWGGVAVVIEEARAVNGPDSRFNGDVAYGAPIDPNRNFRPDTEAFTRAVLADLGDPARLIVALHTNAPGYDASNVTCPGWPRPTGDSGSGEISVLVCNDVYTTRRSVARRWPFDDTDSVVILPYLADRPAWSAFCARRLAAADANMMLERVATPDGSLSNYAVQRGLPYVNLETQDRGTTTEGLNEATGRLVRMVDTVMERCGAIAGATLRPSPASPSREKRRRRR